MFPGSQEGERCHLQPKTFPGSRGDHTIKVWVGTSLGVQGLRLQAPSNKCIFTWNTDFQDKAQVNGLG